MEDVTVKETQSFIQDRPLAVDEYGGDKKSENFPTIQ